MEKIIYTVTPDGKYIGKSQSINGCITQADSIEELKLRMIDSLKSMIACIEQEMEEGFIYEKVTTNEMYYE